MKTSLASSFRCAKRAPSRPEDDVIVWARGVIAQPHPLLSEHERALIAILLTQAVTR